MNTTEQTKTTATYELCYDSREANMLIYRSLHAGICGPASETVPCESRDQAERIAFNMGYMISTGWQSHTNYDSAILVEMA